MSGNQARWVCTMLGAREHYALPVALHMLGSLARLYTDLWAGPLVRQLRFGPSWLRSLATRHRSEIPHDAVVAFNATAFFRRCLRVVRWVEACNAEEQYDQYIDEGRDFALSVNRHLKRLWDRDRPDGLMTYTTGCLETLELFRDRGRPTVVDQIDAARTHERVVLEEQSKWPGWQRYPASQVPSKYWQRLASEWDLADRIVVNSLWSRRALVAQGVNPDKIVIIPLAYEIKAVPRQPQTGRKRVVLYLGRVVLEKGIPYLFEAARKLAHLQIRFIVAGPIGLSADALESAPPNVNLIGPVSRDRIGEIYRSADLFVLPTMSDGFAITQLEAMAHGLPVIATPNCGEVVSEGEDGHIVPAGNALALATAIEDVISSATRLADMSRCAIEKVKQFSLDRMASQLDTLMRDLGDGKR